MHVLLTVIVAGALLWATTAAAAGKVSTAKNITTPSGLVRCHALQYGGPGISCSASYLKPVGELDPFFALKPKGRTIYAERGDYDGYIAPTRKLSYGDTWKRGSIRCTLKQSGLTCRNPAGHGFHLQKGNVRRS